MTTTLLFLAAGATAPDFPIEGFLLLGGFVFLYFFPGISASMSHHHNASAIWACNLLLGWTLIGWAVAFIWACTKPAPVAATPRLQPPPLPTRPPALRDFGRKAEI
jgi:hypothetical protein